MTNEAARTVRVGQYLVCRVPEHKTFLCIYAGASRVDDEGVVRMLVTSVGEEVSFWHKGQTFQPAEYLFRLQVPRIPCPYCRRVIRLSGDAG